MSDDMIVRGKKRQALMFTFLSVGLLSSLWSLKVALNPTVPYTPQLRREINAALARGESYQGPLDINGQKALALILGGTGVFFLIQAIHFSSARPKTLSTPALEQAEAAPEPTQTALGRLDDKTYQDQGEIILERLTGLFDEYEWLDEVVDISGGRMPLLIIIGEPGRGKTALAMSINILRKVMHRVPTYLFDPHADENLRKGVLADGLIVGLTQRYSGKVAGSYGAFDFKGQFDRVFPQLVEQLKSKEEPAISYILDELRNWPQYGFTEEELLGIYDEYSDFRKRGDKPIWLWHARSRTGSGLDKLPEAKSPLTTLLNYAAVIDFNAVPQSDRPKEKRRSKDMYAPVAMYKPMGAEYSSKYLERITIPKILYPPTLMETFSAGAAYFDIRMTGYNDPGLAERRRNLKDRIRRSLKGTDDAGNRKIKSSLENLFDQEITQFWLTNYNQRAGENLNDGFDLEGLPSPQLFQDLWLYLENPNTLIEADENGFYNVRKIQDNWGKKNDPHGHGKRFFDTDSLRKFLSAYTELEWGEWGNAEKTLWKPLGKPSDFG